MVAIYTGHMSDICNYRFTGSFAEPVESVFHSVAISWVLQDSFCSNALAGSAMEVITEVSLSTLTLLNLCDQLGWLFVNPHSPRSNVLIIH